MLKYLLPLMLCLFAGCIRKTPSGARTLQIQGYPRLCPAGVFTSFILKPLARLPDAGAFPYRFGHEGERVRFVPPGTERDNLELRVCLDPTSFKVLSLVSVVVVHSETDWSRETDTVEYDWNPSWIVRGLDEALFQDYSQLEILAVPATLTLAESGAIHIKGHGGYVTAGHADFEGTEPPRLSEIRRYRLRGVYAGELVQDELPRAGECKSFEHYSSVTFTAGTAKFRIQYCAFYGNDSTNFRFVKILLKDANPALREKIDVALSAEDLLGKIRIAEGHHAHGLGFRLDLPQASYVVMDAVGGDGGYDVNLPDAPTYQELTDLMFNQGIFAAVFRAKYGSTPWTATKQTSVRSLQRGGIGKFVAIADGTAIYKWDPQTDALTDKCLLPKNATVGFADSDDFSVGEHPNDVEHDGFLVDIPTSQCPNHKGWVGVEKGKVNVLERDWE